MVAAARSRSRRNLKRLHNRSLKRPRRKRRPSLKRFRP